MGTTEESYMLYDRIGHVEVSIGEKTYDFSGLDFKFKITKTCDGYAKGFADISVLGLSRDTVNALTTLCNMQEALNTGKRVRVFAGYAQMGKEELIIDADISYATPTTTPPESWFTITAIQGHRFMKPGISLVENETIQFQELFQRCIDKINEVAGGKITLVADMRLSTKNAEHLVSNFSVDGCVYDIIGALNQQGNVLCFLDNGDTPDTDKLVAVDKDEKLDNGFGSKSVTRIKTLSMKTGMIGLPRLKESVMLECRSLLDPRLSVGDVVEMESTVINAVNGRYRIIDLTHTGHFRGKEWYTQIRAVDPKRVGQDTGLKGWDGKTS